MRRSDVPQLMRRLCTKTSAWFRSQDAGDATCVAAVCLCRGAIRQVGLAAVKFLQLTREVSVYSMVCINRAVHSPARVGVSPCTGCRRVFWGVHGSHGTGAEAAANTTAAACAPCEGRLRTCKPVGGGQEFALQFANAFAPECQLVHKPWSLPALVGALSSCRRSVPPNAPLAHLNCQSTSIAQWNLEIRLLLNTFSMGTCAAHDCRNLWAHPKHLLLASRVGSRALQLLAGLHGKRLSCSLPPSMPAAGPPPHLVALAPGDGDARVHVVDLGGAQRHRLQVLLHLRLQLRLGQLLAL